MWWVLHAFCDASGNKRNSIITMTIILIKYQEGIWYLYKPQHTKNQLQKNLKVCLNETLSWRALWRYFYQLELLWSYLSDFQMWKQVNVIRADAYGVALVYDRCECYLDSSLHVAASVNHCNWDTLYINAQRYWQNGFTVSAKCKYFVSRETYFSFVLVISSGIYYYIRL